MAGHDPTAQRTAQRGSTFQSSDCVPAGPAGWRVLITNILVHSQSGTELYVRDLAAGLLARGHLPVVFSPRLGPLAAQLRERSVPVVDRLDDIAEQPDIIHGHHSLETVMALLHFPHTPGIFVCHDAAAWHDLPPRLPRLYQYVAVDLACRERLVAQHGIAPERVHIIQNAVDLDRFPQRGPLPPRPARALLMSNYVRPEQAEVIRAACRQAAVQLDTVGRYLGGIHPDPAQQLRQYDLVFAKGRCAWEALATGTAVIVCDAAGLGTLVTSRELDRLRLWNFGRRLLQQPIRIETIAAEIARYDADDAAHVTEVIRARAGIHLQVDQLLALYRDVLDQADRDRAVDREAELKAVARFLRASALSREIAPPAVGPPPDRPPRRRWWSLRRGRQR